MSDGTTGVPRSPVKCGWLEKRGAMLGLWTARWFVLRSNGELVAHKSAGEDDSGMLADG